MRPEAGFECEQKLFGDHGRKPLRRSLLNIIASYKQDDGTVYGRTRPPNDHRASPVTGLAENEAAYRKAGAKVLAEVVSSAS